MITPGKDGQMQEQIDFSKTTQIKCEACDSSTFKQTLLLRKMSALVFGCEKCGHVNKEFSDINNLA